MDAGDPHQWSEINMIPISYRASPVFYVQSARFIVYDNDPEVVALMQSTRANDLTAEACQPARLRWQRPERRADTRAAGGKRPGALWPPYEAFRQKEKPREPPGRMLVHMPMRRA